METTLADLGDVFRPTGKLKSHAPIRPTDLNIDRRPRDSESVCVANDS